MSLTDMSQACGKLFADWFRLKDTKEYLEALSEKTGFSITISESQSVSRYGESHIALIEIVKGGIPEDQGTWGYDLAALELARWLDKPFSIQCNEWVKELVKKGRVKLTTEQPKPIEPSPMDLYQLELLKMGVDLAKITNDARALQVYSTQIQNLSSRTSSTTTSNIPLLPEPVLLTMSEVLERSHNISSVKIQNSLKVLGRKTRETYIKERGEAPKTIEKTMGTNHKSRAIQLYPEDYFERIKEIAEEYWASKGLM